MDGTTFFAGTRKEVENEMIIRVQKNHQYFCASNIPFNDERLSWEARGVMGYLLSKPDDWNVNAIDLWKRGPGGRDRARKILKELEKFHYLKRRKFKNDDGRVGWESVIYEVPNPCPENQDMEKPCPENQGMENQGMENQGMDFQAVISTEQLSTEVASTEQLSTERRAKARAPRNEKDLRTHAPAIQTFRRVTGRYPKKELFDDVIDVLGDDPDEELLTVCRREWLIKGFNPENLAWLFEWYVAGGPPAGGPPGRGNGNNGQQPHPLAPLQAEIERRRNQGADQAESAPPAPPARPTPSSRPPPIEEDEEAAPLPADIAEAVAKRQAFIDG